MNDAARFRLNGIALNEFVKGSKVAAALVKRGLVVERRAKHLCPVDTGRLRASITTRGTRDGDGTPVAIVGTNVNYAAHVEFGTTRQAPKPFLRPALKAAAR